MNNATPKHMNLALVAGGLSRGVEQEQYTLDCDCLVERLIVEGTVTLALCNLHANAQALLDALEALLPLASEDHIETCDISDNCEGCDTLIDARTAINTVKGDA